MEPGCESLLVPSFPGVQPIVETWCATPCARRGALHIDIHCCCGRQRSLVAVADDGLGMGSQKTANSFAGWLKALWRGEGHRHCSPGKNVAERSVYGTGSGVRSLRRREGNRDPSDWAEAALTLHNGSKG